MRKTTALLILPILFFFNGCKPDSESQVKETPKEAMQKIAQAAGVDAFGSVEAINFTFNADLSDKKFVRSWTWLPKSNEVTLHGETNAEDTSYQRDKLNSDESGALKKIDGQFINDLYWLIFPIQVAWDSGVAIKALPEEAAAVFPEAFAGLRVQYPEGVGYTPGDVYDLFYDKDYRVTSWVFRKGGSAEPTRASEWKDYKTFGPLSISLNRTSPGEAVRIWFEDVAVKVAQ